MPRGTSTDKPIKPRAPAKTIESQENRMILLANKLAEKQLVAGTASAQVITHFLELGSPSERLKREKVGLENRLLEAKTEALQSQKHMEELYSNALKAIGVYKGEDNVESDDD